MVGAGKRTTRHSFAGKSFAAVVGGWAKGRRREEKKRETVLGEAEGRSEKGRLCRRRRRRPLGGRRTCRDGGGRKKKKDEEEEGWREIGWLKKEGGGGFYIVEGKGVFGLV